MYGVVSPPPPEGKVRHPASTKSLAVDIGAPFERQNASQVGWSFSSNVPLGHGQPGIANESNAAIAPGKGSEVFDGIMAVSSFGGSIAPKHIEFN